MNNALRSNGSDLVKVAQAARIAQKAQKAQKQQERAFRAFCAYVAPTAIPAETDILADLHKMVQGAQKRHETAVRSLFAYADNRQEAPIDIYNGLKGTFGTNLPNFSNWLKTA